MKHDGTGGFADGLDRMFSNPILVLGTGTRKGDDLAVSVDLFDECLGTENAIISPIGLNSNATTQGILLIFHFGSNHICSRYTS
jgi:hypothetical protein